MNMGREWTQRQDGYGDKMNMYNNRKTILTEKDITRGKYNNGKNYI